MSLEVRNKLHFSGIPPIFTLFFCFFFKPSSLTGFSLEGCVSCLQLPYKTPQIGWLKTVEICVLMVLESRNPRLMCYQVGFFWSLSPWLADGLLLAALSSHGYPSVLLRPWGSSSSYKGTSHIGLGSHPNGLILT